MTVIDLKTMKETTLPNGAALSCALGNFDGVHMGHRALLLEAAKKKDSDISAAWTFRVHPGIYRKTPNVRILTSVDQKCALFAEYGVEYAILEDFENVSELSPYVFAKNMLWEKLGVKNAVCGFNFSFGKNAAGNSEMLSEYFKDFGGSVTVVPPFKIGDDTVSSSLVRRKIESGDIEYANKLLGHNFSIFLPVTEGRKLGRKIGIPTINQIFPENYAVPLFGVYACLCHVDEKIYIGVSNVGVRPTIIENEKHVSCETHILDYSGYLYGKKIRVDFCKFIRPEIKFSSVDELAAEIRRNIAEIRACFAQ